MGNGGVVLLSFLSPKHVKSCMALMRCIIIPIVQTGATEAVGIETTSLRLYSRRNNRTQLPAKCLTH